MALWAETTDADTYFVTRAGIGTRWTDLTTAEKTALLTTAQADLENAGLWDFSAETTPTTAMQNAVCEQAMFLLLDPDIDLRAALQEQGVSQSEVAGETYAGQASVPIAARAKVLLTAYRISAGNGSYGAVTWSR